MEKKNKFRHVKLIVKKYGLKGFIPLKRIRNIFERLKFYENCVHNRDSHPVF